VHKTVIRDCEKQVVMLLCHIAQWHHYQKEGDDFFERIVTLDETWARSYEPHLKVSPTQSNVKAMFIMA
jgi:hypothetical protein